MSASVRSASSRPPKGGGNCRVPLRFAGTKRAGERAATNPFGMTPPPLCRAIGFARTLRTAIRRNVKILIHRCAHLLEEPIEAHVSL